MKKLHVIGGFLALCAGVSCHPIGPPDSDRFARRSTPGASPTGPATLNPAAHATTLPGSDVPAASSSASLNPAAQASMHPSPQARKPATPKDPYLTAEKAPGRPGFVLSPHTGKLVLVEGLPSGVVVPDQTCPPGEKKFFRVP